MNKYKELLSNSALFAVGEFTVKLVQFFLMPLVTGVLTKAQYGRAENIMGLVELVVPILTLDITEAVLRFSIEKSGDASGMRRIVSTSSLVDAGCIAAVSLVCVILQLSFSVEYAMLFALLFALYSLYNIWGQYVRGSGRVGVYVVSRIVNALMLALSTYVLVYRQGLGVTGYLLAMESAYLSAVVVLVAAGGLLRSIRFNCFDRPLLRDMLKYSTPMIANMISWWLMQTANRYVLIFMVDESASGVFIAVSKLASIVNIFSTVFLQAWTISLSKNISAEDKNEFGERVFELYSTFLEGAVLGLLLVLPVVSRFLLKGEFTEYWKYSAVPIATVLLSCYNAYFGAYYGATYKTKRVFVSTMYGAAINLLALVLLAKPLSFLAALIASYIGYLVMTVIRVKDTYRMTGLVIDLKRKAVVLVLITLMPVIILCSSSLGIMYALEAAVVLAVTFMERKNIVLLFQLAAGVLKSRGRGKQ